MKIRSVFNSAFLLNFFSHVFRSRKKELMVHLENCSHLETAVSICSKMFSLQSIVVDLFIKIIS